MKAREIIARVVIGVLLAVVIVALAAVLLPRSPAFQRFLLSRVGKAAGAALHTQVHVDSLDLRLSDLAVDLRGITIRGNATNHPEPLLYVPHLGLTFKIISVLGLEWNLNSITIDHPVVHVFASDNSETSTPAPQTSGNLPDRLFDLAVQHAVIDGGDIYYNDSRRSLTADVHNLQFQARHDSAAGGRYYGKLEYQDGSLQFGSFNAMPHHLRVSFSATRMELALDPLVLSIGPSRLELAASLQNFASPRLTGRYQATLVTGDLRRILNNPSLPSGTITTAGTVKYQHAAGRPAIESISLAGDLNSDLLKVQSSRFQGDVRNLHARYTIADDNAVVSEMQAWLLGGMLDGKLSISNLSGQEQSHMQARLSGISLSELEMQAPAHAVKDIKLTGRMDGTLDARWVRSLQDLVAKLDVRAWLLGGMLDGKLYISNLPGQEQSHMQARLSGISLSELEMQAPAHAVKDIKLTGRMKGTLDARWVRSLQDLVAKMDASIDGEANSKATASAATVPIEGVIHGGYVAVKKEVTLSNSFVRTQQTSIRANGTLAHQSSVQLSVKSEDLREMETIAAILSIPRGTEPIHSLNLSGAASFIGEVHGTTASPTISGQLTGKNIEVRGTSWRAVQANIQAGPSEVILQHGHLQPAGQGAIDFSGQASLTGWSYRPENPFALTIRASQLSAADLARLAGTKAHVSGVVNANIVLHGSQLNPIGQGQVFLGKGSVSGEEVQKADLQFQGAGDSVTGTLDLLLPAGDVRGKLTYYPKQQGYTATLEAVNLQLDRFNSKRVQKLGLAGALSIHANGTGTVKDPALEATLTVPQLQLQDGHLREVRLQASVKNHLATVDLSSEAVRTGLNAHGTVMLQDPYNADVKLDTGTIPLQTLAEIYLPGRAAGFTGQAELHATLQGPLRDPQLLKAHASIPVLTAKFKSYELGAVNPIQIDYKDGAFEIQRAEIRGPDTNLEFEGSISTNQHSPATALLRGNVNLNLLQALEPGIKSGGALQLNIHSVGSIAAPALQGEIRIVNASALAEGAPVGLRNGNGLLKLNNDRIAIDSFQAEVGGGTVTARGGLALTPRAQFDLAFSGKGIQLLYPEGVRSSVDANLTLSGNMQTAYLRGQANVDHLSLTSDFDVSHFADELSQPMGTPSSSYANRIHLRVSLQTTSEVNLSARTLSVQGGANLQVQGTVGEPVILGRVNITGGEVIFLSSRYEITGGTVEFANPTRTEPVLNIGATTTINEYNINLRLEGPLDRLRTNYSSDPSLPPVDIINLLAFGKTTEPGTASTTQSGSLGAESVLASGISSQVTGRVEKLAGISQLSVDPILGSEYGETGTGARIVVQQRVASNLYVAYSADVTSTLRQIIQVRYQLSQRWSLAADMDQNGGYGFDARVRKEF